MNEETTDTVEAKAPRAKRARPIRILRENSEGKLEYTHAQPPTDMTQEADVKAWMGNGRMDAGEYILVRVLTTATVSATPTTTYKVN